MSASEGGRRHKFNFSMRKILLMALPLLAGFGAMPASAQQPVIKVGDGAVDICPRPYVDNEGEGSCLLSVVDGNNVRIYTPALSEIRQFPLQGTPLRIKFKESDSEDEFRFTQYLFDDDEKFEYLVASEDSKKIELYDESGVKKGEFDFGGGMFNDKQVTLFRLSSEHIYLMSEISDESYSYQSWIYPISQLTAGVRNVAENALALSVRPTVTDGSEPVNIDFGRSVSDNLAVSVVAANGSQAMTETIKAGETGISLNVGGLAKGVYVVRVSGYESAKLVIR